MLLRACCGVDGYLVIVYSKFFKTLSAKSCEDLIPGLHCSYGANGSQPPRSSIRPKVVNCQAWSSIPCSSPLNRLSFLPAVIFALAPCMSLGNRRSWKRALSARRSCCRDGVIRLWSLSMEALCGGEVLNMSNAATKASLSKFCRRLHWLLLLRLTIFLNSTTPRLNAFTFHEVRARRCASARPHTRSVLSRTLPHFY